MAFIRHNDGSITVGIITKGKQKPEPKAVSKKPEKADEKK